MKKETRIAKLQVEYNDLKAKLSKLVDFLNKENVEEEVGETQMMLLITQESAMQIYLNTLSMRIDVLEAELEEDNQEHEDEHTPEGEDGSIKETQNFLEELIGLLKKYEDKEE